MSERRRVEAKQVIVRLGAGTFGAWFFVFGLTTFGVAAATRLGVAFDEAQSLLVLVAFPVFVVGFCWAFVARAAVAAWAVFAGGGALLTALGWLLARGAG